MPRKKGLLTWKRMLEIHVSDEPTALANSGIMDPRSKDSYLQEFEDGMTLSAMKQVDKLKKDLLGMYAQNRILKKMLSEYMGLKVETMTAEQIRWLKRKREGRKTDLKSGFSEET